MCPPVFIPCDGWTLSVPAGLRANFPKFVDCVLSSTSVPCDGWTPLQFKQDWIDGYSRTLRQHCGQSAFYPAGTFGDLRDVDHLPGCPDYVSYPLPPHDYRE